MLFHHQPATKRVTFHVPSMDQCLGTGNLRKLMEKEVMDEKVGTVVQEKNVAQELAEASNLEGKGSVSLNLITEGNQKEKEEETRDVGEKEATSKIIASQLTSTVERACQKP